MKNLRKLSSRKILRTKNWATLLFLFIVLLILTLYSNLNLRDGDFQEDGIHPKAKEIANRCREGNWHECYRSKLVNISKTYGLAHAQSVLLSLHNLDPRTRFCHGMTHFMARETAWNNPEHWVSLIDHINPSVCGGGFLHGILEARVFFDKNFSVNAQTANQLCTRGNDIEKQSLCFHWFGHLFLLNELERESNFNSSLKKCENISEEFKLNCYDGIFMEHHFKDTSSEHGLTQLPNFTSNYLHSLQQNCLSYNGTIGVGCWMEIAGVAIKAYGTSNPEKIYEECIKAPIEEEKDICYIKTAVLLPIEGVLSQDYSTPQELLSVCKFFEKDEPRYSQCIRYVLYGLFEYSVANRDRAFILCNSVDKKYRSECFQTLNFYLNRAGLSRQI